VSKLVHQLLDDPAVLWYVARATGLVVLVLLTATVVLGVTATTRVTTSGWPRFVTQGLHRNISLFVIILLAAHIAAVVIDSYVPIRPVDAVVPFIAAYRPFWVGLGVVSALLLAALVVTSLLRQRLGYATWRVVHWISYLSWPLAVVHGLGTGSDSKDRWALGLTVACGATVLIAIAWRIASGWPARAVLRVGAVMVTTAAVLVVVMWARQGPLAPGWSKKAEVPNPVSVGR
jgi:methionine sulfoxide reductase heme-binding subunit